MIDKFMLEYFEESATSKTYTKCFDNIRESLMYKIMSDYSNDYYFEASENYKEAIKEFFAKLIQAIKDLVKKIKDYIHEKLRSIQINRKLTDLKKILVANRNKFNGKKIQIFDTVKYMNAYRKYISLVTGEFRKLTSKKYMDYEEFEKDAKRMDTIIDAAAIKLGLTDNEKYAIETDVFNALSITEKSIKLYDNEFILSAKEWEDSIRTNGTIAEIERNPSVADRIKILSQKFSNICSKCFQFMSKHPIASISIIATAVSAIIGGSILIGSMNGKSSYDTSELKTKNQNEYNNAFNRYNQIHDMVNAANQETNDLQDAINYNNYTEIGNNNKMINRMIKKLKSKYISKDAINYVKDLNNSGNKKSADDIYRDITKNIKWDAPLTPDVYSQPNDYSIDNFIIYK